MHRRTLLTGALAVSAAASSASAAPTRPAASRPAASRPAESRRGLGSEVRTRDGVKLFLREWGEGAPTVFVHSWALSSEMWSYQFGLLGEAGLHCVGFDRRGHGRSDIPARGYDIDTLADDLAAVIDHVGAPRVNLVAHSMGGAEVVRYLSRHGGARVNRVVLLAPTTPCILQRPDNPNGAPRAYFDRVRREWAQDFPKWAAENREPFFTPETSEEMKLWLNPLFLSTPLGVAIACNRAVVESDLRPDLKRIDRPVLVIQGDKDKSAPLDLTGRVTAAGIRGAELKVYPGAPHGLFLTHVEQVNREILTFLKA